MKRFTSLTLIAIFFPFLGQGQDIAHFEKLLNSTTNKTQELSILDSLLIRTFKADTEAFIDYSFKYIALAQELDSIEAAAKKAINLQYPLTTYANDPYNAVTTINGVLARKYKIKDSMLLGGLYLKRGSAHAKIDLNKAIEDYTIALNTFSVTDTLHRADAYLFRGQANSNSGEFVQAGVDYTTAYTLYESKKVYNYMVFAQQGIINMFSMNGFYEKAKNERDILINKMKALGLDSYLANEYYNQALDYKKMDDRRLEYKSLLKAEEVFIDGKSDESTFVGIHSLLIVYYCENGQLAEAKKHLELLETIKPNFEGNVLSKLNFLNGKIVYLNAIGEYDNALKLGENLLEIAKSIGIEDEIMGAHSLLADIYYKKENYLKSIEHSNAAADLKNAIYNKTTANALAYYQTLYEIPPIPHH
ncbi:MAG: hypothetical protein WBA61_01545 [Aequorivita sp.]